MKSFTYYFSFVFFVCYILTACEGKNETTANATPEPPPFVAPSGYDIIQQVSGNLNQDAELDSVLALKPIDNSSPIEIVVFSWMSEEARSSSIIPFRFNTEGTISLAIENNELVIGTQNATEKIKSRFRYIEQKLRLVKIEKYYANENNDLLIFDLLNSKVEDTNSPSRTFTFANIYFEDANPEIIIQDTLGELYTKTVNRVAVNDGSDLVPPGYQVLQDAEGDLNEDGLADKVVAIQNKADKTEEITTIILLKKQDATFERDTTSQVVIPPEITTDDTPLFDSVSLTIENNELIVGVSQFTGNTQSYFRYIDGKFILVKIGQFASGAGEHYSASIDLLNSTLEETRTNTMDEAMPSETENKSFHLPIIYFDQADAEKVIGQALKGHQQQSITGVLTSGGGIDDDSVSIQTDQGQINAYCDGKCGDWFDDDIEGNTGGHILKESLKNKKVLAVIATETSNGRIAGPSDDDELVFIKEIELIDESKEPVEIPFVVPEGYTLFMDAKGDLNGDGINDKVVVIQNKKDNAEPMTTLVLLAQKEKLHKDTESNILVPSQSIIDKKPLRISLEIEDNTLVIGNWGVSSNIRSSFRYINGKLTLVKIDAFTRDISGHPATVIDLVNSTLEQTDLDSAERKTSAAKFQLQTIYFAEADPEKIVQQVLTKSQKEILLSK